MRKADDGWKTVKYNGRFLDVYKLELAQRRLAGEHKSHSSSLQCLTSWVFRQKQRDLIK